METKWSGEWCCIKSKLLDLPDQRSGSDRWIDDRYNQRKDPRAIATVILRYADGADSDTPILVILAIDDRWSPLQGPLRLVIKRRPDKIIGQTWYNLSSCFKDLWSVFLVYSCTIVLNEKRLFLGFCCEEMSDGRIHDTCWSFRSNNFYYKQIDSLL